MDGTKRDDAHTKQRNASRRTSSVRFGVMIIWFADLQSKAKDKRLRIYRRSLTRTIRRRIRPSRPATAFFPFCAPTRQSNYVSQTTTTSSVCYGAAAAAAAFAASSTVDEASISMSASERSVCAATARRTGFAFVVVRLSLRLFVRLCARAKKNPHHKSVHRRTQTTQDGVRTFRLRSCSAISSLRFLSSSSALRFLSASSSCKNASH